MITTVNKNELLDLGRRQAHLFQEDNVAYCEDLITCSGPRRLLVVAYGGLVRRQKLTAIEDLLQNEKEAAWELAKELAKGRLGRRELIEVVKAMYAIEYFLTFEKK